MKEEESEDSERKEENWYKIQEKKLKNTRENEVFATNEEILQEVLKKKGATEKKEGREKKGKERKKGHRGETLRNRCRGR